MHPQMLIARLRLHVFMSNRPSAKLFTTGDWADGAPRSLWGDTTYRMWTDAWLGAPTERHARPTGRVP